MRFTPGIVAFRRRLLKWYYSRVRPMPWRGETDPYRIWLSEVMLQQTQVATVVPYYHRWLKRFPTLKSVAHASEDDVLKAWEGLGYYSRVRNFRMACQQVVEHLGGRVPSNSDAFGQLKGVGPYTRAAVLSIAFHQPLPTIDGNVKRVVARLLCLKKPPSQALETIEAFLTQAISKTAPGDFNQAMMDLGASICTARQPQCDICPVPFSCQAYQQEKVHLYPKPEKKLIRPHYQIAVGVIVKGDLILVSKRKDTGMLAGLWEFSGGKIHSSESPQACVKREVSEELGLSVRVGPSLGKVRHGYTHFSIEMEAFICHPISGKPRALGCAEFRWIRPLELKTLAFPKASHKVFPAIFAWFKQVELRLRTSDPVRPITVDWI